MSYTWALQHLQKCNQRPLIFLRQLQPELVPFHGTCLHPRWLEAARYVVVPQTRRVEHLFEARKRPIVQIAASVPDALQRWNLVITCPFSRFDRQTWVR